MLGLLDTALEGEGSEQTVVTALSARRGAGEPGFKENVSSSLRIIGET